MSPYMAARLFLSATNITLQLLTVAGSAVVMTLFAGIALSQIRELFGPPGRIELTESELVLDSPSRLLEPRRVPLSQVRLATVDESSGDKQRFPVEGVEVLSAKKDQYAWLWRKNRSAVLPAIELNPLDEIPNLAIVFDPPLEEPGKKTLGTFLTHVPAFLNRRIRMVVASVENPVGARDAFAALRLLRPATAADLTAAQPGPEDQRHARRDAWISGLVIFLVVGSWVGGLLWSLGVWD